MRTSEALLVVAELERELAGAGREREAEAIRIVVGELGREPHKRLLSTTEAAGLLGVTAQTVKNWAARGTLKAIRVGDRVKVPIEEIEPLLSLAEASRGLDPTPAQSEINDAIAAGRESRRWSQRKESAK